MPALPPPEEDLQPVQGNLTASTVSGLRWGYGAALGNAVVQAGYAAAMSRLLDPLAFGLMAITTLVVDFAVVPRRDPGRSDARTPR